MYSQLQILSVCQIKLVIIDHTSLPASIIIYRFNQTVVGYKVLRFELIAALILATQIDAKNSDDDRGEDSGDLRTVS